MIKVLFFIFPFLLFLGCSAEAPNDLKYANSPEYLYLPEDMTQYVSEYRRGSGLYGLKFNPTLAAAAQNHAKYSISNSSLGHDETAGLVNFTGASVSARAQFAGYSYLGVLENIAHKDGRFSPSSAIDGLFSAIYHRFTFLNPTIDEIGHAIAKDQKSSAYVFVAGNSFLESFCRGGRSDGGSGMFYTKICTNSDLKISQNRYKSYIKFSQDHIKFPDTLPTQPYFSGEVPDPFPECKITANPVSIEFNPKFGEIKMQNFELFKDGVKIKRTKTMDAKSDINARFSPHQFAVFAYDALEFNATYRATFSYISQDKPASISWEFRTKTPQIPYFDLRGGEKIALAANQTYELFFRPRDCNDLSRRYDVRSNGLFARSTPENGGANTLIFKFSGLKGDTAQIVTDNGIRVQAVLLSSSPEAEKKRRNYVIVGAIAGIIGGDYNGCNVFAASLNLPNL